STISVQKTATEKEAADRAALRRAHGTRIRADEVLMARLAIEARLDGVTVDTKVDELMAEMKQA
ncbi:hypothetical protein LCGC14_2669630, partial [marine sediment metagenome]